MSEFCAVIDTETSGLSLIQDCIIQMAIVPVNDELPKFSQWITRSHGIYTRTLDTPSPQNAQKMLDQGIPLDAFVKAFKDWFSTMPCAKIQPIYHNAVFDVPRIAILFESMGLNIDNYFHYKPDCTLQMARIYSRMNRESGLKKFRLQDLVEWSGGSYDKQLGHDALYDALKTRDVYNHFMKLFDAGSAKR